MIQEEIQNFRREIIREIRQLLRPKRLFSIDDAAYYLGIAPKTIRNGLGPKAKHPFPVKPRKLGGRVVFEKSDLDKFVDSL